MGIICSCILWTLSMAEMLVSDLGMCSDIRSSRDKLPDKCSADSVHILFIEIKSREQVGLLMLSPLSEFTLISLILQISCIVSLTSSFVHCKTTASEEVAAYIAWLLGLFSGTYLMGHYSSYITMEGKDDRLQGECQQLVATKRWTFECFISTSELSCNWLEWANPKSNPIITTVTRRLYPKLIVRCYRIFWHIA